MKKQFLISLVLLLVLSAFVTAKPVQAVAYGSQFVTSITYQNVGTGVATVNISFYPKANGTAIDIDRPDLPAGAATSLYVGGLAQLTPGFAGSAVMSSSQPLATTLVQVGSGTVKNRPLSGGFSSGASSVLIPTVLKNTFNYTSIFSVQNVDSVGADVELMFYPTDPALTPIAHTIANLPSGSAEYIDMGSFSKITTASFNGSVKIAAKKTGTTTPGSVVASSLELQTNGDLAYAFEGAIETATTVYMPSALCQYPPNLTNSAYAVQNTSATATNVTVTYSNGKVDGPVSLASGAKKSFDGCGAGNPVGFIGSGKITTDGGQIVAVGKIYGGGLSTAFLGFASGGSKISLPYVRWTESHWLDGQRQRAYIAIQNIGASDLAAGLVTVKYYDKNGALVGTDTLGAIPVSGKVNSNASKLGAPGSEFGAYPDGSFGGAAIVEGPAGSQLAVVVRIQTYINATTSVGEDYQGTVIQ